MFGHHQHRRHGPLRMRDGQERGFDRGGFGVRGPGRGGRRGGRPFDQGDLRYLVLDLVRAQPRHGYEIIKAIEDALGGHYSPSPGVIYPTLTLLEETGYVASQTIGAKRLYTLTPEGQAHLDAEAEAVAAVRARLQEAARNFGGRPPPEVVRAMDNLKAALQLRLAKGMPTGSELQALTGAIDAAASAVERS